jgi:hypothetical protein
MFISTIKDVLLVECFESRLLHRVADNALGVRLSSTRS